MPHVDNNDFQKTRMPFNQDSQKFNSLSNQQSQQFMNTNNQQSQQFMNTNSQQQQQQFMNGNNQQSQRFNVVNDQEPIQMTGKELKTSGFEFLSNFHRLGIQNSKSTETQFITGFAPSVRGELDKSFTKV